MTYQPLLLLNSLLFLFYGLGLLVAPTMFAGIDHYPLDAAGAAFGRMWGGPTIGLALMCFLARDFEWSEARRAVTFSLFIANSALFAVITYNELFTGIPNMLGWVRVALHLVFAINSFSIFYMLWRQY
jgi:hypothetical protein